MTPPSLFRIQPNQLVGPGLSSTNAWAFVQDERLLQIPLHQPCYDLALFSTSIWNHKRNGYGGDVDLKLFDGQDV